jgi:hypothetical protein
MLESGHVERMIALLQVLLASAAFVAVLAIVAAPFFEADLGPPVAAEMHKKDKQHLEWVHPDEPPEPPSLLPDSPPPIPPGRQMFDTAAYRPAPVPYMVRQNPQMWVTTVT